MRFSCHHLLQDKQVQMAEALRAAGADLRAPYSGKSPFIRALGVGKWRLARWLLGE
jgi:hypothetical protein